MRRAEQEVIGALITDDLLIAEVANFLLPEMFEDALLGRMYYEYRDAYENLRKVSHTEVMQRVIAAGAEKIIVSDAVKECLLLPLTRSTIRQNAEVIRRDYVAQKVRDIFTRTDVNGANVERVISETVSGLNALTGSSEGNKKTLAQLAEENKDLYFKPIDKPRLNFGLEKIDEAISGIEGGDMILIAARPAVGKSAFALQIIRQFAADGKKVAYFNLEMRERQVYERFLASESGLALNRVRLSTTFHEGEQERYTAATEALQKVDNIVVYSGSQRVGDIREKARGYDVIVIDYLQLLRTDGRRGANRYAEVGDISRGIKAIAMDYNIPVIALSQLNRMSEGKSDREPMMADLRESGDLEQDASVILMLWNPDKDDQAKKMLKIEKARQGTTARQELVFKGEHMKFTEWNDAERSPFD